MYLLMYVVMYILITTKFLVTNVTRTTQDNSEELHYLKEERDNAYKDIKDLEDELADAKILVISMNSFLTQYCIVMI